MDGLSRNSAAAAYAADSQYRVSQAAKSEAAEKTQAKKKVSGRTIGDPVLSEKAQKYYEKLKAKYSNMDFILVSPEKKEEAERNKGMYQSSKELLVLIDSDKIEQMAEDESYRKKYESILSGATAQMNQMKSSLGTSASRVSSFGMTFDDHGNASLFAVVDKSMAAQKERIKEKRAESAKEKKEAAKKAAEKKAEEAKAADKNGKTKEKDRSSNQVTVTASSFEELLKKIEGVIFEDKADSVLTDAEKAVGRSVDYTL